MPACSCGPVAVVGNTYAAMAGQGKGCRARNSKKTWCEKTPADFCGGVEPVPTPGCTGSGPGGDDGFAACAQTSGVGGVCFNETAGRCVSATELAQLVEAGAPLATDYRACARCTDNNGT